MLDYDKRKIGGMVFLWPKQTAAVRTKIVSQRSGLYVDNVMLRPNRSLNRNLNRSSLYINNGDVTQTAAVRTAAVCLGHYEIVTLMAKHFADICYI